MQAKYKNNFIIHNEEKAEVAATKKSSKGTSMLVLHEASKCSTKTAGKWQNHL